MRSRCWRRPSTGSSCGRRSRRWRSRGSSCWPFAGRRHVRRIGWCALLMVALQIYVSGSVESWTVAGAFGQRRFVALTILLTIGLAAPDCRRAAGRVAAGARRGARRVRVVERGAHRGVRHRADESTAPRIAEECVRCVRDAAAAARRSLALLRGISIDRRLLLPARQRSTDVQTGRRILYFADIRFPLERANGIQTMETCHALAGRGHEVHLVVRPDTHTPARDPFEYYGLAKTDAPDRGAGAR